MSCDVVPCHETKQQISHKIKPNDREIPSVRFPDFVRVSNDLVCSQQQYKSFKINVVMIIGNIPKQTVAPYTVAGALKGFSVFIQHLSNFNRILLYFTKKPVCFLISFATILMETDAVNTGHCSCHRRLKFLPVLILINRIN